MNRADAGMIQRRGRATFPLETIERASVFRKSLRQEFDRDGTVQTGVAGFVNLTHSARPKELQNHIGPDLLARRNRCFLRLPLRCGFIRFQETR
jgi:hypothetical protein